MTHLPLKTNLLNQPLTLPNGVVIPNRLAKAATSETLATYSNNPTEKHIRLYQRWASSGIGMIITGNIMIDRRALGEPGNVVVEDERDFEKEKAEMLSIVKAFHERGAAGIGDKMHPTFGPMKAEQWGKSMWKHLDHHLRQFGL